MTCNSRVPLDGRAPRATPAVLFALQALGEYGALTGGGASGMSGLSARVRPVVEWAADHRVALGVVLGLAIVWILVPARSPD